MEKTWQLIITCHSTLTVHQNYLMNLVNLSSTLVVVDKTDSHTALQNHLDDSDASAISSEQQPVWALYHTGALHKCS